MSLYHGYREREFFVNPIGNGSVLPEETRTGNPVKVFVRMNKFNSWPAADFAGMSVRGLSVYRRQIASCELSVLD